MVNAPRAISGDMQARRTRLYELAPQMRLYHRVLANQAWEPFVMRACAPNIRQPALQTDQWGMRRTVGRDGREFMAETIGRDEPVDIVTGTSFSFGVGASGDEATLPSRLAQATGRATLSLSGHQNTLAQNFIQFMFFAGRYHAIRNVVLAGFGEIYYYHTCDALLRQYGMFPFNRRFMTALNGEMSERTVAALYGAKGRPFVPLTKAPERAEAERAVLNETIRSVLSSWSRFATALGARLTVVMQPTPALQDRALSPEEIELLESYDRVSGISRELEAAAADHRAWHRQDMAAMAGELGFAWIDVNDRLGAVHDGRWLHIDRIHMSDLGYRTAAEAIVGDLK